MPATAQIVLCTCPDDTTASRLADGLVSERLAACVNVLPGIRSVYLWEGKIEKAGEVQLIIKTNRAKYPAVEQFIQQQHPYEVPEIIACSVTAGLPAYLKWLEDACK
jgi:periplasmic divalent cation tolerance protein